MDKKIDSQNTLPTTFIILGATGDLMRQKLIPALFHLYRTGSLPTFFQVVGFARDDLNREGFQQMVREMAKAKVEASEEEITAFAKFLRTLNRYAVRLSNLFSNIIKATIRVGTVQAEIALCHTLSRAPFGSGKF